MTLPPSAIGSILMENFKKHHFVPDILSVYLILKVRLQMAAKTMSSGLFTQCQTCNQSTLNAIKERKPTFLTSLSKSQNITLQATGGTFIKL